MENLSPEELHQFWSQQVSAWKTSGVPQAEFCRNNDLVAHRFTYWKRKLQTTCKPATEMPSQKGFVKVQALQPHRADQALTLTLTNGTVLSGFSEANLGLVRQLVEVLS